MRQQSRNWRCIGTGSPPPSGCESQESILDLLLAVGGDEGALALAANQQILGGQFVDSLTHRALADAKRAASSSSLGIASPGFHSAGLQAPHDRQQRSAGERAEGGRATIPAESGGHSSALMKGRIAAWPSIAAQAGVGLQRCSTRCLI